MKNTFIKGLLALGAVAMVASCADYNDLDNFKADPDPTVVEPYKDYKEVKSYLDREKYPNMTLGATLKVADFNKQELAHAAAITNFDNISFGTTLMSGAIVNGKGMMNFIDFKDLLDHVDELGAEVFGSPLAANANQADEWMKNLTAPVEIRVPYINDVNTDFSKLSSFTGHHGNGKIVQYDGANVLQVGKGKKEYLAEDFELDEKGSYTITVRVRCKDDSKSGSFFASFCSEDRLKDSKGEDIKYSVDPGKWVKVTIETNVPENATGAFFEINNGKNVEIYISDIKIGHYPYNRRPQTAEEITDTIHYAMKAWCDGLMEINKGRIQLFDLIEDAIDSKSVLNSGDENEDGEEGEESEVAADKPVIYDLKHAAEGAVPYWQDALGSENYAPVVAKYAREAYERYGGDPAALKFFISESDLIDEVKFNSLKYWMEIWDANGANIQGINAKFSSSFSYYEDPERQQAQVEAVNKMLANLASTGKLIRLSNFDIRYTDIDGKAVKAADITDEQRQNLADYYAYIIKSYMTVIPADKQAGICKGNMADAGSEPVGLWRIDKDKNNDWVRTATYKAFCDALSGK